MKRYKESLGERRDERLVKPLPKQVCCGRREKTGAHGDAASCSAMQQAFSNLSMHCNNVGGLVKTLTASLRAISGLGQFSYLRGSWTDRDSVDLRAVP
ncbi:hypothetical protein U0070_016895 [Myodes glareolus]|uniref:Uncharacterized protein n=1 Tax=Myodes glareolus TaxID=447135 RepID=A0AAW0IC01_MYOGA